jgi:hypothetical protein
MNNMKKIITIAILLFSMASYAQGNLQFNQVLNIKNGDTYTVPSGKTLKIITVVVQNPTAKIPLSSCTTSNGYVTCNYYGSVTLGSISNIVYTANNLSTGLPAPNYQCSQCPPYTYISVNPFGISDPIWLKAGEIVSVVQGSGILISAIEFNIVP